jgi:hypothetical protein
MEKILDKASYQYRKYFKWILIVSILITSFNLLVSKYIIEGDKTAGFVFSIVVTFVSYIVSLHFIILFKTGGTYKEVKGKLNEKIGLIFSDTVMCLVLIIIAGLVLGYVKSHVSVNMSYDLGLIGKSIHLICDATLLYIILRFSYLPYVDFHVDKTQGSGLKIAWELMKHDHKYIIIALLLLPVVVEIKSLYDIGYFSFFLNVLVQLFLYFTLALLDQRFNQIKGFIKEHKEPENEKN